MRPARDEREVANARDTRAISGALGWAHAAMKSFLVNRVHPRPPARRRRSNRRAVPEKNRSELEGFTRGTA